MNNPIHFGQHSGTSGKLSDFKSESLSDLPRNRCPIWIGFSVRIELESLSELPRSTHLATLRMLFDWLVVNQVVSTNPAAPVRGPKHSVTKGITPVLSEEEARALLESVDVSNVVGLRDRALIALMCYTFARVEAALSVRACDYYPQGKRWWLRLTEKNNKVIEMPVHHKLEHYLDTYLTAAKISEDPQRRKSPIFLTTRGRSRKLSQKHMSASDACRMIRRRANDVGIASSIRCHSFRATGITNYLVNGG